jgi:protein O-mannosyl-transferase
MDAADVNREPAAQSSQARPEHSAGIHLTRGWALALVLAVTFIAYAGTLRFEFVYDDIQQIAEDPTLRSIRFAPAYFAKSVWDHQDGHAPGNYYRPIFMVWLMANYLSFGPQPVWWHLTTIIVHLLATMMVYFLVYRLLKDDWIAGVAALIFGLHPVHIEVTAWISGVTESLLAGLFIPALICYVKARDIALTRRVEREISPARRRRASGWMAASLAFYGLALLAKETAIVFPLLVVAYELTIQRRTRESDADAQVEPGGPGDGRLLLVRSVLTIVRRVAPYLVITALYLIARAIVLKAILHPLKGTAISKLEALLTAPSIVLFYIKQLIWPVGLSGFYDLASVKSPWSAAFIVPSAALALIAATLWWAIKRLKNPTDIRAAWFAAGFIILPILPVLNISAFRSGELVHDRYLYLPSIGLSVIIALALRRANVGRMKLFGQPAFQVVSVLALTGALGFATANQHIHWTNDLLLYRHGLTVAPNSTVAKNNLADLLSKNSLYDEAITLFHQVVDSDPSFWEAKYNLGYNYYKLGKYDEAEWWLRRSTEINKTNATQFLTLGVVLFETNRLDEAEATLRHGIALKPDGFGLHYALGAVLKTKGDLPAALHEFKREVTFNPQYVAANEQIAQIEHHLNTGVGSRTR